MSASDVDQRVRERAFELGFDVVGVARADEPLDVEHDRYRAFIEAGMHGTMQYLEEHVEERRRLDTEAILPGARSVVCVGRRYARSAEAEAHDPEVARGIARYARGQDYHLFLRKKLRRLAEFIRGLGPGIDARPLCDIEPLMERAWAARAGLGFVGKNGLVIVPGQGSFVMLGEVVTTLVLTPGVPMHERCGACTRCLDACPTGAFPKPFVLDARKCISYLTIEQYEAPPEELRAAIGEHLFGCDVCQEVCPYNRTAPPPEARTQQFHPLPRWSEMRLSDLASIEEEAFPETTQGTPLRRARRGGLARNAAIVAANRLARDPAGPSAEDDVRTLEQAAAHDDAAAREVGVWGLLRIGKPVLREPGSSGPDEDIVDPDAPPFAPRR
ncbi:tRNA epoxyqueuosine(34) reductase QueG [Polyangium sorediatum]|uniref:tRNA epoxyqueuosine(34) reductase QueG n=1 Tax=Polyangium sorediatum TaxID=889274 RepID=A0ABT6NV40_9BACT|nr:tRNA epoxyqueuosine(34) reductase QueG [Polyangium sorediatum]MDI1432209.1 tRNA epoxyqueuosine(34) reductase QueG [Polyangium sorediatum]